MPETTDDGLYYFIDNNVFDGTEYTYSITSYDMGIRSQDSVFIQTIDDYYIFEVQESANPDNWAWPDGYKSLESAKGSSQIDKNYIKIIPGHQSSDSNKDIKVVPNPFIVRSGYNTEGQHLKRLRFTNLPEKCSISIFTISGERVIEIKHDSLDGNAWWDLRTVNNQEIAPGIYFYNIKNKHDSWVGKFAIIR